MVVFCSKCDKSFFAGMDVCPHCGHRRPVPLRTRLLRILVTLAFLASVVAAGYYVTKQIRNFGKGNYLPPPGINPPAPRDPASRDPSLRDPSFKP